MKEKIIKLYNYDELSKDSKEKVLKYFRDNERHDFLEDSLYEILQDKLKEHNIIQDNLKMLYSLSYCQGDGFCFIGNFNFKNKVIHITHSSHYYHKRSTTFLFCNNDGEEIEEDREFKELYYKICEQMEEIGYSIIENDLSEEIIKENIEANEYYFRENGEMENE